MVKHEKKSLIKQLIEYFISGGVWFWSGYIIISFLDDRIDLFWANFIGNAVGISLNFVLSRYWVFDDNKKSNLAKTTWRYVLYTALNAFLLNYLILEGLRKIGIEPEIGQFIASGFFTFWNYFWYKYWVFSVSENNSKKGKK